MGVYLFNVLFAGAESYHMLQQDTVLVCSFLLCVCVGRWGDEVDLVGGKLTFGLFPGGQGS